jgi:hypothetical protein
MTDGIVMGRTWVIYPQMRTALYVATTLFGPNRPRVIAIAVTSLLVIAIQIHFLTPYQQPVLV